jgi:hypothetical protein
MSRSYREQIAHACLRLACYGSEFSPAYRLIQLLGSQASSIITPQDYICFILIIESLFSIFYSHRPFKYQEMG